MSFGDRFLQSVMGNAVRIQNEISKVVKPEGNAQNCCTACRSIFNVLHNRKRQCGECREHFCPNCLIRIPSNSFGQSDRRICNRCRIFTSNFSWDDLMQLKARDLKWFLDRRRIRTEGLKEKEQLADMIMFCFGSDRYYQDQAHRQQRVALMTSNMQEEFPSVSNNESHVSLHENREPSPAANSPSATSPPPPPTPPPAPSPPPPAPTQPSPSRTSEEAVVVAEPQVPPPPYPRPDPPPASGPDDVGPATPVRSRTDKVHLIDFKTCEEVDELSVKQLKVLLTSNHVDYRGCCEKTELVTKAKRLVSSHLENVKKLAALNATEEGAANAGGGEDDLEDDMCKICMDALIDCVLLECGHMVTCLDCGKRMAECPICRQYVVRAVRIFKA